MKLLSIYIAGILAAVFMVSCNLNETIYSSAYTDNFYKTSSDAEKALVSAYGVMSGMYSGPAATLVADFSDDEIYPRAVVGRNTFTLFSYDNYFTAQRTNGRMMESPQQIWSSCYSGIEKLNWILLKVPATNMDETRKKQIIGEAHFLRGFFFWMLTKNFGDVPVKTFPSTGLDSAYANKSPKADVYKQIYSDLDSALDSGIPSYPDNEKGRPSLEAVSALYAKAALYNEDWGTALQKAENVINSGRYSLMEDVRDVYRNDKEDQARVENIWAYEADPISPGTGHQLTGLCGPPGSAGPEYAKKSYGSMFAYQAFFDSFDPSDKRRLLLDTTFINKQGQVVHQANITPVTTHGVLIKKYQDPESTIGMIPNIPIFRYPDVILIAAEAEAHLHGGSAKAYGYVNRIRHRAGLNDLPTGLNQESFIDSVLQERAWEFFAEGDRWYDLTRTGKFLKVISQAVNDVYPERNVQAKNKYFPIPQDEINANPGLEQNPDWK